MANFQEGLLNTISGTLEPIVFAAEDIDARIDLFSTLGYDYPNLAPSVQTVLDNYLNTISTHFDEILLLAQNPPTTFEGFLDALVVIGELSEAIYNLVIRFETSQILLKVVVKYMFGFSFV
jgi:hypothetical protein